MNTDKHWELFEKSGKIEDYLCYVDNLRVAVNNSGDRENANYDGCSDNKDKAF